MINLNSRLASSLGRHDETPNVELAREIVQKVDAEAVKELIANLHSTTEIQNDSIKVLYEIAYLKAGMISNYADDFIDLLSSKNNRLVWGSMTALGTIVNLAAEKIWNRIGEVIKANDEGSVITQDWGIRVLAGVSRVNTKYEERLFPYLMDFLSKCIPRDIPKHAESILIAVNQKNKQQFLTLLKSREHELKPSQMVRLKKIYKQLA